MKAFQVRMSEETHLQLRATAAIEGKTMNELAVETIEYAIAQRRADPAFSEKADTYVKEHNKWMRSFAKLPDA
jgi:hypothetical protein